jgi:hypothetical protein
MRTFNNVISVIVAAFIGGTTLGLSYGVQCAIIADVEMHKQGVRAAFASMKR